MGYLRQMSKLGAVVPEGAFYTFSSITDTGMTDVEFCSYILEEAGVAIVPGEPFEMPGFVRIAYCKSRDYLTAAMESMKRAVQKL